MLGVVAAAVAVAAADVAVLVATRGGTPAAEAQAGGTALWSTGIMAGHAVYWVSSGSHVARVSTRTGRLTKVLPLVSDASLAAGHVPPNPTAVAVADGAVWVTLN